MEGKLPDCQGQGQGQVPQYVGLIPSPSTAYRDFLSQPAVLSSAQLSVRIILSQLGVRTGMLGDLLVI